MSFNDAEMIKTGVRENVDLYIFTNPEAEHGDAITVIRHENRALLIDTAFPEYSARVKADLGARGIEVAIIILSHYHADHASGCSVFPGCEIYAHRAYEPNYTNCLTWESRYTFRRPTHTVTGGDGLVFGTFNLEFIHAPGHSKDSIITRITGTGKTFDIFHGGDLIMNTKDRYASLPFIADGGNFQEHTRSLELLKEPDPDILLLPHGGVVDNKEAIHEMIDDRLYYLERTFGSMGTLPLPACLKNDISNYRHLEFHDTNLMRLLV